MNPGTDRLSLYMFDSCPWCQRVLAAVEDLGLVVERRDVRKEPHHATALKSALGKGTVPVLRVDSKRDSRWIPESRDIVSYLYRHYGEGRSPTLFATGVPQAVVLLLAVALMLASFVLPSPVDWLALGVGAVLLLARNNVPLLRKLKPGGARRNDPSKRR